MKAYLVNLASLVPSRSLWYHVGDTGAKSKPERLLMICKLSSYPTEI